MKLIVYFMIIQCMCLESFERETIADCFLEEKESKRLYCYDSLFRASFLENQPFYPQLRPSTLFEKQQDSWLIDVEDNEEFNNVYLYTFAQKLSNGVRQKIALFLRCQEQRTEIYTYWGFDLGARARTVVARFDQKEVEAELWLPSESRLSLFLPQFSLEFIRKILAHEQLSFRLTNTEGESVIATFNIKGLKFFLQPLRESCHW